MTTTIQIRRGNEASLPADAAQGEFLFCLDSHKLFSGMGAGIPPVEVAASGDASSIGGTPVAPGTPSDGEVLIFDAASGEWVAADPVVSGPDAPGSAPTRPPVQIGAIDSTGKVQRLTMTGTGLTVGGSVGVSNFPATQPISAAALPLPAGAATETSMGTDGAAPPSIPGTGIRGWLRSIYDKLVAGLTVSGSVSVSNFPGTQPVSGSVSVANFPATQPISAAALPLPAGAATETSMGTDGAAPPSIPGTGIRGWLRSIYDRLGGALTTTENSRASTTVPTAVSDGAAVITRTDKYGNSVTVLNQPRDLLGTAALSSASATAVVLIAAGAASVFNDIISLIITNESATATVVSLSDNGAAGNIYKFALAPNGGIVINFPTPLPQGTAAAAWDVLNSAAVALDYVAVYAKEQIGDRMPPAFVQSNLSSSTTSGATSFGSNVVKGNLLLAVWEVQGTSLTQPTTASVTDTVGSVWTPAFGSPQNVAGATPKVSVNCWFAIAGASGANSVSLSSNSGGTIALNLLAVFEFSGFASRAVFDSTQQSASGSSTGATSHAAQPLNFTTTRPNAVVAVLTIASGGTPAPSLTTVNSPFVRATSTPNVCLAYALAPTVGASNFTATWTGASFTANGYISAGIAVAARGNPNSLMLAGAGV